jgi:hypothetical protein
MKGNNNARSHSFEFPNDSGSFSIELIGNSFSNVTDEELYKIGKVVHELLYGLLLENPEMRENCVNIIQSVFKDIAISIEDKDIDTLLVYSNRAFRNGDYNNSLFLSQLILGRINQIIDKKIANNDKLIDKEIIHLQISTLNFIGYLFSKLDRNIDYGLKLTNIAFTLLREFDENDNETIALKSAVLDTLGVLYSLKKDWDSAIVNLITAHECDRALMGRGQLDEISFRLTCSNLGYALANKSSELIDDEEGNHNIHEIEDTLRKAYNYFLMVPVDKAPPVPEKHLKSLELCTALKTMKKGLAICDEVRKKLQKRLI